MLISTSAENQGNHASYRRAAVWDKFGFVRVQHGKITYWWSAEDTISKSKQLGYTIEEPEVVKA